MTPSPHYSTHAPIGGGGPTTSLSIQIETSEDDVEERKNGRVYRRSNDLELAYYKGEQVIGLRWSVNIPKGSIIHQAYIQFTAAEKGYGSPHLDIKLDDDSDSDAFSSKKRPSRRTMTSAVDWKPAEWDPDMTYDTPDFKHLLQGIVNKFDWTEGNAVSAFIGQAGGAPTSYRVAHAFDGDDMGPVLKVVYGPAATNPGHPHVPPTGPHNPHAPTGYSRTVRLQIENSEDDVEEVSGDLVLDSTSLELPIDTVKQEDQVVGLRFMGSGVPQGAEILKAYLEFTAEPPTEDSEDQEEVESPSLTIYAEAADYSKRWDEYNRPSQRTMTVSRAFWSNLETWTGGSVHASPDVTELVREVTSRQGWSELNAISFIIVNSDPGAMHVRIAESFDKGTGGAPRLVIQYKP